MTRHSFIITYDTETKTWEWDTDQESNRLDGTVEINGNYESIGSSSPALMELEDIMSTRLGTSLRILNEHEATNPVAAEAFASPLYYSATLEITDQDDKSKREITTTLGIIPYGFEGETEDLPHDDKVFYWLQESEARAGFSGEEWWSIDDFGDEVSL
jgi:hypothetical protein